MSWLIASLFALFLTVCLQLSRWRCMKVASFDSPASKGMNSSMQILRSVHDKSLRAMVTTACVKLLSLTVIATLFVIAIMSIAFPYYKMNRYTFFMEGLKELRAGYDAHPPIKRYERFVRSKTRLKYELSRESVDSKKNNTICTRAPCPGTGIVDTDAIAGPLYRFKRVEPAPQLSSDISYRDFWKDFGSFPVVIRDALHVQDEEIYAKQHSKSRASDTYDTWSHAIGELSASEIMKICNATHKVTVGYEIPDSEEEFGGLHMIDVPFEDFYRTNVLKKCDGQSIPKQDVYKLMHPEMSVNATSSITMVESEKSVIQQRLIDSPEYCGKGYIFDHSVFKFCPKLLDRIPMVKFHGHNAFVYDYTVQISTRQWPSLFIGNANTKVRNTMLCFKVSLLIILYESIEIYYTHSINVHGLLLSTNSYPFYIIFS